MSEPIINKHFTTHLMPYLSVVLETKLHPPSQRSELIARPRLHELLADDINKLTLICVTAPAGYGKTSLLSQWFEQAQARGALCAWITLDQNDNDRMRYVHALVEAVRKSQTDFGTEILSLIERGANLSSDTLMALFVNAIDQLDQPVRIFVDDFHLITHPELLETLNELFMRSPKNLKWIVAMRHTPLGMSLSRLRALGKLAEINVDDLRFTITESREFFARHLPTPLRKSELHLLADRTEGWVAGLQLASLSLQKVQNPTHWIQHLSGEYRDIADFLTEEVLRTLDESTREFLLQTAILTRLNRDLCAAVTQRQDCHQLLERVIASHLFIFSLDETGDWYRYHHLFAELLDRRLREANPDHYRELHQRASHWFEENHLFLDAIHHACCAEDMARAASLLDHVSETLFSTGHVTTLEEQANRIPNALLKKQPRLMMDLAWQAILRWEFSKGTRLLNDIQEELQRHKTLHATTTDKSILLKESGLAPQQLHYLEGKLQHRQMMLAAIADQYEKAEPACEAWLAAGYVSDPAMHMLTSIQIILQSTQRDRFILGDTMSLASQVHQICVENNVLYGSVYHDVLVGLTCRMQAEYTQAESLFNQALSDATDLHGYLSSISATPGVMLANLYYTQNRLTSARELVNEHLQQACHMGLADQLKAYMTKARLYFLDHHSDAAFQTLNEGMEQANRFGFERVKIALLAEKIHLHLLHGDHQEAAECGRQLGVMGPPIHLKPDEFARTQNWVEAISWARLAVYRDQTAGALRLLKQWWQFLQNRRAWEPALQTGLCLTQLAASNGDYAAARSTLLQCLKLKGASHSLRYFLDEGQSIYRLLLQIRTESQTEDLYVDQECLARLINAFDRDTMREFPPQQVDPVALEEALLKDREVEILELAADDRSNAEIAARLAISQNTVKWYWQQIFTKLDVHRRGRAVSRARELGLIS